MSAPSFSKNTPTQIGDSINVSGKNTLIKTKENGYRVAIADEPIDAKVDGKKMFCVRVDEAGDYSWMILGFTPMEAIRSATLYGGQIMMRPNELGVVKDGFLADLLLVDGDPLANLAILRDPKRILAVMKDGVFAKAPDIASQRAWGRAA